MLLVLSRLVLVLLGSLLFLLLFYGYYDCQYLLIITMIIDTSVVASIAFVAISLLVPRKIITILITTITTSHALATATATVVSTPAAATAATATVAVTTVSTYYHYLPYLLPTTLYDPPLTTTTSHLLRHIYDCYCSASH